MSTKYVWLQVPRYPSGGLRLVPNEVSNTTSNDSCGFGKWFETSLASPSVPCSIGGIIRKSFEGRRLIKSLSPVTAFTRLSRRESQHRAPPASAATAVLSLSFVRRRPRSRDNRRAAVWRSPDAPIGSESADICLLGGSFLPELVTKTSTCAICSCTQFRLHIISIRYIKHLVTLSQSHWSQGS